MKHLILYFIIGGILLSGMVYCGAQGKSYWSAFIALLPIWILIPLITIYNQGGMESALNYAQGLILITIPWLLCASILIWFAPFIGLVHSSIVGLSIYIISAFVINWIKKL